MGNKCCQIEEVASILNIIKALVENVSTSISTQTAITTVQQYINHFNGNLISDFRLEPDNRTITIELANGNTFPLVLDRVVDVRLNQAGTAIDITYSDASLNHSIPFPTFSGIAISNPSNVVLSGNGTVLTPLTAEARIEVQDSSTISITGNGTISSPIIAEYTGPLIGNPVISVNNSTDPLEWDVLVVGYRDGSFQNIILPIRDESFQVDVPILTKNGFDGFIPLSDYDDIQEWIVDESNLSQYDLNSNALINCFDDVYNKIFRMQGTAKLHLEADTGIVANKGGLALLDLSSTNVQAPFYPCRGVLSGRYTVLNGINLESYPLSGEVLMNQNSNKLLMYLSFVEYGNINGEIANISFSISYNY